MKLLLCDDSDKPREFLIGGKPGWAVCCRCFETADAVAKIHGRWPEDSDFGAPAAGNGRGAAGELIYLRRGGLPPARPLIETAEFPSVLLAVTLFLIMWSIRKRRAISAR
jgi:hypothetical protein